MSGLRTQMNEEAKTLMAAAHAKPSRRRSSKLALGYASEYGLEVLDTVTPSLMSERMDVHLPAGCDAMCAIVG